jgi:hypothetical protein
MCQQEFGKWATTSAYFQNNRGQGFLHSNIVSNSFLFLHYITISSGKYTALFRGKSYSAISVDWRLAACHISLLRTFYGYYLQKALRKGQSCLYLSEAERPNEDQLEVSVFQTVLPRPIGQLS